MPSSTDDLGQLIMVVRNPGEPELIPGSTIPLSTGFQSVPPSYSEPTLFEETNWWLVWLILLGGVAALLPALQHTFPLLWTKRSSNEEE